MIADISKRYYSSAALAQNPFDSREAAYNRLFVLGHVREHGNNFHISINQTTPTCARDAETVHQLQLSAGIKTSAEWAARSHNTDAPSVLFAGLIVWVIPAERDEPHLALVRQGENARWPGRLNFPEGQCSEDPIATARRAFNRDMILVRDNHVVIPSEGMNAKINPWQAVKQEQVWQNKKALEAAGFNVDAILRNETLKVGPLSGFGKALIEDEDLLKRTTIEIAGGSRSPFPAFGFWSGENGNAFNLFRIATMHTRRVPAGKTVHDVIKGADGNGSAAAFGLFTPQQLAAENVAEPVRVYLKQRGSWATPSGRTAL